MSYMISPQRSYLLSYTGKRKIPLFGELLSIFKLLQVPQQTVMLNL